MLGILACGGLGSRLGLFTKRVSNKHLALVYDKPMIMYPIQNLVDSGVKAFSIPKLSIIANALFSANS